MMLLCINYVLEGQSTSDQKLKAQKGNGIDIYLIVHNRLFLKLQNFFTPVRNDLAQGHHQLYTLVV